MKSNQVFISQLLCTKPFNVVALKVYTLITKTEDPKNFLCQGDLWNMHLFNCKVVLPSLTYSAYLKQNFRYCGNSLWVFRGNRFRLPPSFWDGASRGRNRPRRRCNPRSNWNITGNRFRDSSFFLWPIHWGLIIGNQSITKWPTENSLFFILTYYWYLLILGF